MSRRATYVNPEENEHLIGSAAPGAANVADLDSIDKDLASVVGLWPSLPEVVRVGILAMVQAASGRNSPE